MTLIIWVYRAVLTAIIFSVISDNFAIQILNWANPLYVILELIVSYIIALFLLSLVDRFTQRDDFKLKMETKPVRAVRRR